MAQVKVCSSVGRIACIEKLPPVFSDYPINIEIEEVRYYGSVLRYSSRVTCVASCFASSTDEVDSLLKCFGLDWVEVDSYASALELLQNNYEQAIERYIAVV